MNPAVGQTPPLVCMRATNVLGTRAALSANWKSPPATMPEMARIALAYSAPAETGIGLGPNVRRETRCYRGVKNLIKTEHLIKSQATTPSGSRRTPCVGQW